MNPGLNLFRWQNEALKDIVEINYFAKKNKHCEICEYYNKQEN